MINARWPWDETLKEIKNKDLRETITQKLVQEREDALAQIVALQAERDRAWGAGRDAAAETILKSRVYAMFEGPRAEENEQRLEWLSECLKAIATKVRALTPNQKSPADE